MRNIFIILLISMLVYTSCKSDEGDDLIPYVTVNFTIYPNTLDYIPIGQYEYFTGGYKGILIYRPQENEFMAYERACPYDPLTEGARVTVDGSGLLAVDTVCGSKFSLLDGSPMEGPAKIPLKQYRTSYNGDALYVYN
ncbi:MAG TPA: hypothetical protein VK212_00970 [Lentimicrobium sp.]|nr:hypothetical protein [Lentimicrobium sp.]